MSIFKLHSDYVPTGDQPQAIEKLTEGLAKGIVDKIGDLFNGKE